MGGLGSTVMANHLCAIVEGRFENFAGEFFLTSFTDVARDLAPHVGDENYVLQRRVTAKSAERVEVPFGSSGKPSFGDAVEVDDPASLDPSLCLSRLGSVEETGERRTPVCACVLAKKSVITC